MSYDRLAHFYDLENADFIEDLDFWVDLARESGGPVLELGCGSGRVTQQIARAGVTVVGLDNSPAMLDLARAKLNLKPAVAARAALLLGGMTDFDIARLTGLGPNPAPSGFALIIVPFNTFMHLLTASEQLALLACARRHLAPGGRLVMDLTNPAPAYADPPAEALTFERAFRDEAAGLTIEQFSTLRLDRTAQIAHIVYRYDALAADGALNRTLIPLTLRYTFPAEMSLLLAQSGFRLAHLYGDYAGTPLEDESERMLVTAEAA
jgi:SAM-dependent methyltransferase